MSNLMEPTGQLNRTIFDFITMALHTELVVHRNCEMFVGGSRRLGYSSNESDLDLHILCNGNSSEIHKLLLLSGFEASASSVYLQSDSGSHNTYLYHYKDLIHLILYVMPNQFHAVQREHEKVEKFLQDNPLIGQYISKIREPSSPISPEAVSKVPHAVKDNSGSFYYKCLISLMNSLELTADKK